MNLLYLTQVSTRNPESVMFWAAAGACSIHCRAKLGELANDKRFSKQKYNSPHAYVPTDVAMHQPSTRIICQEGKNKITTRR